MAMSTPPSPEPSPIDLEPYAELVNNALANRAPLLLAYVDPDGQPSLSYRGSTQVHSPDQLQIWVRNPEGGLLAALPHNDRVTLWYRNEGTMLQLRGRARVLTDPAARQAIYDSTPEPERKA